MNAEEVERHWLLLQSGELATEDAEELKRELQSHPDYAEVSEMNETLLSAAREALSTDGVISPLPQDQRETILTTAQEVMGNRRAAVRSNPEVPVGMILGLPRSQVLALAATLVLLLGAGFMMLRFLDGNNPPPGTHTMADTTGVDRLIRSYAAETEAELTKRLALDRTDYASALEGKDVDELLQDLALLDEIGI